MKLLRYKEGDLVKPGILDKENKVRNVSSLVEDWNKIAIRVVQDWNKIGTRLAQDWTGLEQDWHKIRT